LDAGLNAGLEAAELATTTVDFLLDEGATYTVVVEAELLGAMTECVLDDGST